MSEINMSNIQKATLWQRLGFGACAAPYLADEDFPDMAQSRMVTDVVVNLSWPDRLRLLISGRLMVSIAQKTDVIVGRCVSKSKVGVLQP